VPFFVNSYANHRERLSAGIFATQGEWALVQQQGASLQPQETQRDYLITTNALNSQAAPGHDINF